MPPTPKYTRRWFKFGIRALLFAVVVFAVMLAWVRYKVREQGVAVAALTSRGCSLQYRDDDGRSPTVLERMRRLWGEKEWANVTSLDGRSFQITDADLLYLRGLPELLVVNLEDTEVTDIGLANGRGLSQLGSLNLQRTQVTDTGLENLRGLTRLVDLDLSRTQVTDAGLVHLTGLSQLESLLLSETQVTDAGLEHLAGLSRLESLNLDFTQVTGRGLVHLRKLPRLQSLELNSTPLDDSGMANLGLLTQLVWLNIGDTKVTDASLAHLAGLLQLQSLNVENTPVTAAGLMHLEGLTQLQLLQVGGSRVSFGGANKLKKALPDLSISRDEVTHRTFVRTAPNRLEESVLKPIAKKGDATSGSGGGHMAGSLSPSHSEISVGGPYLTLSLACAIKEGISPGMNYAVVKTSADAHFAYFCVILHRYSEDSDDLQYDCRVKDERGEIKQSLRISDLECPLAYSVTVDSEAKENETLKIRGAEVDLSEGRLLVLDMTGDALVIKQAAIPQIDIPKEKIDQSAEQILSEVGKSLKDGTFKTRLINGTK
jgi:Leucine-rich repeat (LRR) protein